MNLENLKKAAIEKSAQAIKKVMENASFSETETKLREDEADFSMDLNTDAEQDTASDEEFDDFLDAIAEENNSEDDTDTGKTQKFNLQNVLNKVRQKSENIYNNSKDFISNAISDTKSGNADNSAATELCNDKATSDAGKKNGSESAAVSNDVPVPDSMMNLIDEQIRETKELSNTLNSSIEDFKAAVDENIKTIENHLLALSYKDNEVEALKEDLKKHINSNASSTAAINGKMSAIESKLTEISNSLSSISKLNDSIFDLKNSQMNSKNSLEELSTAFIILKKKCITGVVILSIVSVLILIMEVINLLS